MRINNLERYVLEELRPKAKSLIELERNTKIAKQVLINVLQRLIIKGLVKNRKEQYFLIVEKLDGLTFKANEIVRELSPTISNMVRDGLNNENNSYFKMKRFKLGKTDQVIFKNLLQQLEQFIDENSIAHKAPIKEHQIFFSLSGDYLKGIKP